MKPNTNQKNLYLEIWDYIKSSLQPQSENTFLNQRLKSAYRNVVDDILINLIETTLYKYPTKPIKPSKELKNTLEEIKNILNKILPFSLYTDEVSTITENYNYLFHLLLELYYYLLPDEEVYFNAVDLLYTLKSYKDKTYKLYLYVNIESLREEDSSSIENSSAYKSLLNLVNKHYSSLFKEKKTLNQDSTKKLLDYYQSILNTYQTKPGRLDNNGKITTAVVTTILNDLQNHQIHPKPDSNYDGIVTLYKQLTHFLSYAYFLHKPVEELKLDLEYYEKYGESFEEEMEAIRYELKENKITFAEKNFNIWKTILSEDKNHSKIVLNQDYIEDFIQNK